MRPAQSTHKSTSTISQPIGLGRNCAEGVPGTFFVLCHFVHFVPDAKITANSPSCAETENCAELCRLAEFRIFLAQKFCAKGVRNNRILCHKTAMLTNLATQLNPRRPDAERSEEQMSGYVTSEDCDGTQ
jgi:hypothetical protein